MRKALVIHYMAEFLDDWLKALSVKFPLAPLSSVQTNYLYMPDEDGNSRLKQAAFDFCNTFKALESMPDADAFVDQDSLTIGDTVTFIRDTPPPKRKEVIRPIHGLNSDVFLGGLKDLQLATGPASFGDGVDFITINPMPDLSEDFVDPDGDLPPYKEKVANGAA